MKKHYKRILVIGIVMILMLATTIPALGAPEKVRVFVEFAPGAKGKVQQALQNEGAQFHYAFDDLNSFVVSVPESALKGLAKNPNVVGIEEDAPRYPVRSTVAETAFETAALWSDVTGYDGAEVLPWGVQAVQAPQAWDAAAPVTGAGVTVCIIDTGYYEDHEDLPLSVGGMAQLDAPYTVDGYGHGSHVAGTIAAIDNQVGVIGVSPDVSLYIVKFFGNDGAATYASDLIAAANDCAANGADIISMSLSGASSNRREQRAFDTLYANGVLSFGAASNDGVSTYHYPASYSSVVSVAALDANEEWAEFSNFNDAVEIAAPGVDVLSTIPYIDSSYIVVDGVTYAGFHVEFSGRGDVSGALVNGGLCASTGAWSGKVVLCERGDISFAEKVLNVEASGGVAALIYNNVPNEELLATMGEDSSAIISLGFTQEIGQYLLANKLGVTANVSSIYTWPASGYESWQGTSMATPHASAVAALLWSANPSATNVEIREAMNATAKDLGAAGRDVYYGYGLVQAYDALVYLGGSGPVNTAPSVAISSPADGSTFDSGALVSFAGSASDAEDGNLSASISWSSSIDGALGTGAGISAALSDGTHIITASVTDSGGLTDTDAITVTVGGGGGGALFVNVNTNKAVYGDREWVTITVTVTDGSAGVAGASVTTKITTASGSVKTYTGLTGADGIATVTFKTFIRKDGAGTYTVNAVATLSGYTDGAGSATFLVQ